MSGTIFVCIRHLETAENQKKILQGLKDTSILAVSPETQAKILEQQRLLSVLQPFETILCSELIRTHQTAEAYGYFNFQIEPLLNEFDYGDYVGKTKYDLLDGEHGPAWREDPRELIFGESVAAFTNRLETFVKQCNALKNVLIFGHGTWIRGLLSLQKHGDLRGLNHLSIGNNALVKIQFS